MMRRWQQVVGAGNHPQAGIGQPLDDERGDAPDRQRALIAGDQPHRKRRFTQGIDGLIGVQFVEAVAVSHAEAGNWVVPDFALSESVV